MISPLGVLVDGQGPPFLQLGEVLGGGGRVLAHGLLLQILWAVSRLPILDLAQAHVLAWAFASQKLEWARFIPPAAPAESGWPAQHSDPAESSAF